MPQYEKCCNNLKRLFNKTIFLAKSIYYSCKQILSNNDFKMTWKYSINLLKPYRKFSIIKTDADYTVITNHTELHKVMAFFARNL